jgi:hypothetical protein
MTMQPATRTVFCGHTTSRLWLTGKVPAGNGAVELLRYEQADRADLRVQ